MCLQILGLGTVAYGLGQIRRLFQQPTLLEAFWAYIKRFPKFRPEVRMATGGATATMDAVLHGEGVVHTVPRSLEERVTLLERALEKMNASIRDAQRKIKEEAEKRDTLLATERREREAEDTKISELLQETMVGGIHLEVIGVLLLFVGILMATASNEIACVYVWISEAVNG